MPELYRELRNLGFVGVTILLVAGLYLAAVEGAPLAIQWCLQSAILWALVWHQTGLRLQDNRAAQNATLYTCLGWANRLTILRGFLIALSGGFLLQNPRQEFLLWLPAFFYSVAAILDRVDGYVARRTRHTSLMGNALDNVFDALGLLVAPLLALDLGKIHWTYLCVSFAYYGFHLGLRWRAHKGRPNFPLLPNKLRRTLAGFQMGYVAVALWPPFDAEITRLAGIAFMAPILTGFAIDWLVVSGRLNMQQTHTRNFFDRIASLSFALWQPLLRLVFLFSLGALVLVMPVEGFLLFAFAAAALPILLGSGARIGALLALILLGIFPPDGNAVVLILLLFSATWIMLLGSGRYSLWQGDDHWVERQDGGT